MRIRSLLVTLMVLTLGACGDDDGRGSLADAPVSIDVNPDVPIDTQTDADGDGFAASMDCDDNNAAVNPDAPELCNDIDDNCTDGIDEGTATFDEGGDGTGVVDVSAMVNGTMATPAVYTPPAAGTLKFCGASTYFVRITTTTQLEIAGKSKEMTILDAAMAGSVVESTGAALNIHDVTVTHGKARQGGGVDCLRGSLAMKNAIVVANHAALGGDVSTDVCNATVEDTIIENNTQAQEPMFGGAGAGYANLGSQVTLRRVTVRGNMGQVSGGIANANAGGRLELIDSIVTANGDTTANGGGVYTEVALVCTNSQITANTNYGVYLVGGNATLTSTTCDYGTDAATNNTPNDVFPANSPTSTKSDFGNDASFTCTNVACTVTSTAKTR